MSTSVIIAPIGVVVLSFAASVHTQAQVVVQLPGDAADMVMDSSRELIYVSVPEQDAVLRVSATTYQVIDQVFVGDAPWGLELSEDGGTLFAALNTTGSVGLLDLESGALQIVDLEQALGDPRTYDVAQARSDRLFVSANPGSSGLAHIVAVDLIPGFPHLRVAGNRFIRCAPTFEKTNDQIALYIGECFSPPSLYKLDILDPNAPIVLEDDHGTISSASFLEVGEDLSRIFLMSGQVLDTRTFLQIGLIGSGVPRFGSDPRRIYALQGAGNHVAVHDAETLSLIQEIELPCPAVSVRQFLVLPDFGGFLVLGSDNLCAAADHPIFPMPVLTLAEARVSFEAAGEDSLRLTWVFELSASSDGLDPATEAVRVSLGTFSESIPAGSFVCTAGFCRYASTGPGVTRAFISDGIAVFEAAGLDLSGTPNPVSGLLEIGNDFGSVEARLSGSLRRSRLADPGIADN